MKTAVNIDHVHFYLEDAKQWCDWFVQTMGFQSIASFTSSHTHTEVVNNGAVTFILSSPVTQASPVAKYLRFHPPGIADIAFAVRDLATIIHRATSGGAKIIQPIQQQRFTQGMVRWCQIQSVGDLRHTIIERLDITPVFWDMQGNSAPFFGDSQPLMATKKSNFTAIDHIVLNVAVGKLTTTVAWYEKVFGFAQRQAFNIQTQNSALSSQVLVHPLSNIKLPVNEPASANSQIQEFLDYNHGAGVQHIALSTPQIASVTAQLRAAGLSFLSVDKSYYQQLKSRDTHLHFSHQEWLELQQQGILIECQYPTIMGSAKETPLLLQIFTQPIFNQPTFFFELIERRQEAQGFGEGNFRALFAAIEREQLKRDSLYK